MKFNLAVVCDPPCVNGVCVENDTCHCAAGYEGSDCSEKGIALANSCLCYNFVHNSIMPSSFQ